LRRIDDGLVYHVINRGNNRQPVFAEEGDYLAFLQAIADLKERKPFELYGYCLMGNHVHLLLRPQRTAISRIVQIRLSWHRPCRRAARLDTRLRSVKCSAGDPAATVDRIRSADAGRRRVGGDPSQRRNGAALWRELVD